MQVVWIGQDPSSSGPRNVDFWSNERNAGLISQADLQSLDQMNLVNQDGSAFDPTTVTQLQNWLQGGNAKNAAYMLSVQLATMDLNVMSGFVKTTEMVYAGNLLQYVGTAYSTTGLDGGGFISVGDLLKLVNNALGQYATANGGDAVRNYLLSLTLALGAADYNFSFVQ